VRVALSAGRFLLPRSHLIQAIFISIFLYFYISISVPRSPTTRPIEDRRGVCCGVEYGTLRSLQGSCVRRNSLLVQELGGRFSVRL
jgi:hypothetical protein